MKKGIELIAAERQRQIEVEGWTPEHDAQHDADELALAACCYAYPDDLAYPGRQIEWPWAAEWWKPSPNDRVRELVKAGALIAAEIDRLQNSYDQIKRPGEFAILHNTEKGQILVTQNWNTEEEIFEISIQTFLDRIGAVMTAKVGLELEAADKLFEKLRNGKEAENVLNTMLKEFTGEDIVNL